MDAELVAPARQLQGADARLISLWSLIAATAVFVAAALATMNWQPPVTALGWTTNATRLAAAGAMSKATLVAPVRPAALAASVYPVPLL